MFHVLCLADYIHYVQAIKALCEAEMRRCHVFN